MANVALVTGAAVRIGRAIAIELAANGWTVAVHYRNSEAEAREVVEQISGGGGKAACFAADLSQEADTGRLFERVASDLGTVRCLVNNASVFEADDIDTATRESWMHHFEINLRAPFALTQSFVHRLPASESGNVINILDQRVWNLTPHFMSYTLTKSALWTLTQTSAMALAPRIRVNAIGPGPTLPSHRQSDEDFQRQVEATPLQRAVEPTDVARAVMFILETPSITGQMIALDAGQHLSAMTGTSIRE